VEPWPKEQLGCWRLPRRCRKDDFGPWCQDRASPAPSARAGQGWREDPSLPGHQPRPPRANRRGTDLHCRPGLVPEPCQTPGPAAPRPGFALKGKGKLLRRVPRAGALPDTGCPSSGHGERAGSGPWSRAGAGAAAVLAQRGPGLGDGVRSHRPPRSAQQTWGHPLPPLSAMPRFTPSPPGVPRLGLPCRNETGQVPSPSVRSAERGSLLQSLQDFKPTLAPAVPLRPGVWCPQHQDPQGSGLGCSTRRVAAAPARGEGELHARGPVPGVPGTDPPDRPPAPSRLQQRVPPGPPGNAGPGPPAGADVDSPLPPHGPVPQISHPERGPVSEKHPRQQHPRRGWAQFCWMRRNTQHPRRGYLYRDREKKKNGGRLLTS